MTMHQVTILEACRVDELFGRWFAKRGTWDPWLAFLAALFGLPMSHEQAAIYRQCVIAYVRKCPKPSSRRSNAEDPSV